MASSNCWKCLWRPNLSSQLTSPLFPRLAAPTSAFSTTSVLGLPPPKKASKGPPQATKGAKTLRIKKKAVAKPSGKPPAQGERKAMRKRIVLSNTNALEVKMPDLNAEMVDELVRREWVNGDIVEDGALAIGERDASAVAGKVVGLTGSTVDSLRAVEAFKTTQGWGLFRRPGLLVREEGVVLSRKLMDAQKNKSAVRLVLDGDRGTGKSLMLMHAMATAFVKGWVVLNIPEAQEVTNAVTDYAPVPGTTPKLWSQNTYIANWLGQIAKANDPVLLKLEVQQEHKLPFGLPPHVSLTRLCELGARDPDVAWPIFQAFWSEITAEGRPPVLMCLDSLSFAMGNSEYRAPDYSLIHSHDLVVIRHFMNYLSGSAPLPNGGAIIAATNRSHAPLSKSLNLAIQQAEDKQVGRDITQRDPFEKKYDERAEKAMDGVEVMRLKGLSKKEARSLMEYWAQSGVLRSRVDEETVAQRWTLAGNGVVGEIQRGALYMRI